MADAPHAMSSTQTVNTPLTINCSSQTSYSGSPNQTTQVVFSYQGNILWATMVNNTMTTQTLTEGSSAGPVKLEEGSKVVLQNLGGTFNILFTGIIKDSGSANNFNGTNIGSFTIS